MTLPVLFYEKICCEELEELKVRRTRFFLHCGGRGERAASRAMLHAVGFKREDFQKSQIGVASTWSKVTPCNMHIDKLAVSVARA